MERIKELVELLNAASRAYYQENRSVMSDLEYDRLYDELVDLEKSTGFILANSPTQRVGYTVLTGLEKVVHEHRMLSLDKTKEPEKLRSFLGGQEGLLSWKLDGLTIVLRYSDGVLRQAVTRGNGEIGEDITHNARVFKNVPLRIGFHGSLVLRGEAVISYEDFYKINEVLHDEDRYKNPRNLCSGTVRQLNSEVASGRNVAFYAFSLVRAEAADTPQFEDQKVRQLQWLEKLGFDVVECRSVTAEDVIAAIEYFKNKLPENGYGTDGLVLTYNSIAYSGSLGATSKFPRDSVAFKWADETAETVLTEVQWNTSRTGLINPVAIFEPVELEGTTVNKASLHNVSILEGLELGIGDRITVYKANMIIPQVAENLTRSGACAIPKKCPVCHFETEIVGQNDVKSLYCTNPNCRAQLVRALTHYASRDAMNIDGLSEASIEKFVGMGFLENYTDLYELWRFEDEIKSMEGFGQKSFGKLMDSIEKSKTVPLPNFIYALGIRHVGLANAKLLCQHYDYDLEVIKSAQPDELITIEGFGEVITHSVAVYFADEKNTALLEKAASVLTFNNPAAAAERSLAGLTFVITGDTRRFVNRKELRDLVESLGGKVASSVTGKTSYLINNDTASGSSKNKKAGELGVPVISEDEFLKLAEGAL